MSTRALFKKLAIFRHMKRKHVVVPLLLLPVLTCVSILSAQQRESLAVAVAVPQRTCWLGKLERIISCHPLRGHFHVVVTNVSDKPQRVWRETYSSGRYALMFEITDSSGKTWVSRRKWSPDSCNVTSYYVLAPGECVVFDVQFGSKDWENFPIPATEEGVRVQMRAIYEIQNDEEARERGVWSGKIVSQKHDYLITKIFH